MDPVRARRQAAPLRPLRWLAAAVAALALLTAAAACGSAAGPPPRSGAKYADAVAQGSLVYLQVSWRGRVVVPRDLYTSRTTYIPKGTYGPYSAVSACSGFVASATGDIVTAGHCVDPGNFDGGEGAVISAMLDQWRKSNGQPYSAAEKASRARLLRANARVEGSSGGAQVDRSVAATAPAVSGQSRPADVLAVQPFTKGDVALLRAAGIGAAALPVMRGEPQNGDAIVAAGYPGDVARVVDSATPAAFNPGTVSGRQTVNGTPFTQISAQVSPGMSGGPVVTMDGQVAGTVSWSPTGSSVASFMADTGAIRSLLAGQGVNTTLTRADRAFRDGLAYYSARRYHEAVAQFDQVLALRPGLTLARDYRKKALAAYPRDVNPPSGGLPWWGYVAIGAGVLILAGAAAVVMARRRPGPGTPAGSP